jgi:hypothetical protein
MEIPICQGGAHAVCAEADGVRNDITESINKLAEKRDVRFIESSFV